MWGHLLTFLGGPRACIGYRFSLVEYVNHPLPTELGALTCAPVFRMKALLFTLVRSFEFELAVPVEDVEKRSVAVQRPVIKSAKEKGSHMPLLVKRYQRQ